MFSAISAQDAEGPTVLENNDIRIDALTENKLVLYFD
jgi:hypothetical protein